MYQLRYLMYLGLSVLGGAFLTKYIPHSTTMINAVWLMAGNILWEVLDWKYNTVGEVQEGTCDCGVFNSWTQDGIICGNCGKKLNE